MIDLNPLKEATLDADLEGFLKYFLGKYSGKIALASSLGAEDQVLTDILCKIDPQISIFTLDTGRLHQETHDLIQKTNEKYNIKIKIFFPNTERVEQMVRANGPNLFYKSIENRKLCCQIRKTEPLKRALLPLDVWITGLRRAQAVTRTDLERIEYDEAHDMVKINPLVDWSEKDVWEYIKKNDVPYNALHDQNFPSIGCAPCTRAVADGGDIRSGRWWWENPEDKECGLHIKDGKVVRKKDAK